MADAGAGSAALPTEGEQLPPLADDPVLSHLQRAEEAYRAHRGEVERLIAALHQARGQLDEARRQVEETRGRLGQAEDRSRELDALLAASEREREHERARADRHAERARRLADALKDIHRAVFSGNIYELLLKACLMLTGATRGLYITVRGQDQTLRIRAAIDVDDYPHAPPSEYLKALAFKVLGDRQSIVCNRGEDRDGLPTPAQPAEEFHNFIVAPVVLMKGLDGILIAADKMRGDFDDDDVEMLVSVGDQASVALENHRLRQELQRAYLTTITALADAVEAKDAYTAGHCERVARYALRIAEELALPPRDRSVVFCAGLMHDVGKIGVSDGVLNKPGDLLPEERELVRSHVRVGHDLVHKVPLLNLVADAVLRHHEWYDGSGYPDGLRGDEIPFTARIVSVADAYSAMIDRRVYKEPRTPEQAREELERCAGSQFDPRIVEAFIRVLDRGDLHREDDEDEAGFAPLLGLGPATLG
jgi:putative nucleotidyltransferase with HDIG domain